MRYIFIISSALLVLLSCSQPTDRHQNSTVIKADVHLANGESLFKDKCSSCHRYQKGAEIRFNISVLERLSEEYFIKYIQNSKKLKDQGDGYAQAMDKEYDYNYEHRFNQLTDNDIQDLIKFIKTIP